MRETAEIEFRGVSHSYREGGPVLEKLDFQIPRGQFVTLLGPSGCGKSTILRLIAGFEKPTSGEVRVSAQDRSFVFQEAQLLPWRTTLENAALPLELRGDPRAHDRAREALTRLGLGDALAKYPNQLSGGMKMRVSVARALVGEARLLLLDEPFAALDDLTRHHLQEDLRRLYRESQMTVVFVTHSVSEAVFLSDRVLQFSTRPAHVRHDVPIDLGERDPKLRFEPGYVKLVSELSQDLTRATGATA